MNIKFRQGSDIISDKLIERAQVKLNKLSRFITERNYEALVYVDIERESGAQSSEKQWRASVHLDLAGDRYNAAESAATPEKATELAIKELKGELKQSKAKHRTMMRRSGSFFKFRELQQNAY